MSELTTVGPDYQRQQFIGGSDIAGILEVSPWATRVSVWQRKTEPREPKPSSGKKKLFQRGKVWEAVVAEMLVAELESRDHRVKVIAANKRYVDPLVPYFAAEIDYEIMLDDIPDPVNVELKTVHPNAAKEWGEADTDECPVWYAAQAMWGLGITGRKCCLVAPLFGADEIRVYPIVRDDETIRGMRERAQIFWEQYVVPGVAPEPVNLADANRLFKREADTIVAANEEMQAMLLAYRTAQHRVGAEVSAMEQCEFHIKRFMREGNVLQVNGKTVATWKSRANAHLDQSAFKAEYPKLYQKFMVRGSSRVFEVRSFKPEVDYDERKQIE